MAAHLYPGVKSLQLVLDTPYDTIRTTDIRDDLMSVKVWYSTTSGFNPANNEGILVPSGNSLAVTISDLLANTRYYVRYAFISAIDPDVYTISNELTQLVLTEGTTIYGYLSNDPTPIVTAIDGTGADFSTATGTFKVYSSTTEVTGNGPVYAIKANSTSALTGVSIDPVSGVYNCTGLTEDSGSVIFTALYNNVLIEQVWNVFKTRAGQTAPLIQLSASTTEFVYKDSASTTSLTPQSVVTARLVNITGTPTFTVDAYKRDGTSLGSIPFTQNNNVITISQTNFDSLGVEIGTAKVTATLGIVFDVITLYRINDGTEQITVELSNEAHVIPANNDGSTVEASYVGSGTVIKVKQGNSYLPVDNSSPYPNGTWRVTTITSSGITCDPTPSVGSNYIEYDAHSSMTADVATIDYTITGTTSSGVVFNIVKRQSFSKSKEGVTGSSAKVVNIVATRQSFITAKNSTTITPNNIVLTAIASNFVNPTFTWLVDGAAPGSLGTANGNTFTLNSFAAVGSKSIRVTATDSAGGTDYDIFSVYSLREGDDAFIVGLSNENQTIACDATGAPIDGQFPLSSQLYAIIGTNILTGATTPAVTFAKVSYNGGDANSYSISSSGIITINSLNSDSAQAVFSATLGTTTLTKTFTLSKAKAGATGATGPAGPTGAAGTNGANGAVGIAARVAYQLAGQASGAPTYSATTSGGTSVPAGWQADAPTATVGNVVWYIYGRYNSNSFTHEGIAANTTAWSSPIAASIFQDIRSDNWNGQNPANGLTPNTVSTWGTAGYYIDRTNGNMYASAFYSRGSSRFVGTTTFDSNVTFTSQAVFEGAVTGSGLFTTAVKANSSGAADIGVLGLTTGSSGIAGVQGVLLNPNGTAGVFGFSSVLGLPGILARNSNDGGTALEINGWVQWRSQSGAAAVGISPPPTDSSNTTKYLRADGTWATITSTGGGSGTVTSVTGSGVISVATGTTTPVISISQASSTTSGYLSSTDWNTFNNKSNTNGTVTNVSGSGVVSVSNGSTTPAISISQASSTTSGYLSSADWNTFNNKSNTSGTVTSVGGTGTVSGLTLTGSVTSSGNLTLGGTLAVAASAITSGTISPARLGSGSAANNSFLRGDNTWQILASIFSTSGLLEGVPGVVTIKGSGPLSASSSGGVTTGQTITISSSQAGPSSSGYLSSADWNTFNNKSDAGGTVTSVGLSVPTGLSVSGSPVTSSGTLSIGLAAGYSIPSTASQSNWDTAYSDRLKWDGGSAGLSASTARSSLGLGSLATQNSISLGQLPSGTSVGNTFYWTGSSWVPGGNLDTAFTAISGNSGTVTTNNNAISIVSGTGTYTFTGSGSTLTLQSTSDIRLKENIAEEVLGIDFVKQLRPVTYHRIGDSIKYHGFIAQDLEKIINNTKDSLQTLLVTEEHPEGIKGLDYVSMIGPLTKAVQQLIAIVETMAVEIKSLR